MLSYVAVPLASLVVAVAVADSSMAVVSVVPSVFVSISGTAAAMVVKTMADQSAHCYKGQRHEHVVGHKREVETRQERGEIIGNGNGPNTTRSRQLSAVTLSGIPILTSRARVKELGVPLFGGGSAVRVAGVVAWVELFPSTRRRCFTLPRFVVVDHVPHERVRR